MWGPDSKFKPNRKTLSELYLHMLVVWVGNTAFSLAVSKNGEGESILDSLKCVILLLPK